MASKLDYDPTEFSSAEAAAGCRVSADAEFGMPRQAYDNKSEVGRHANRMHYKRQKAINDEFGWGNTTDADLRRRWDID